MLEARKKKYISDLILFWEILTFAYPLFPLILSLCCLTGMRDAGPIRSRAHILLWEKRPNMLSEKMHNKVMCCFCTELPVS